MTQAILAALLGHWRRNPLQLITLLAGLALGTALWSGVQAINAEARASYDAAAATLGEGRFAQITARGLERVARDRRRPGLGAAGGARPADSTGRHRAGFGRGRGGSGRVPVRGRADIRAGGHAGAAA